MKAAAKADVTILVVGLGAKVEAEGVDRSYLTLPPVQQALLKAVQTMATKLVVCVVSAGGVALSPDSPDAILQLWYGGEEAGNAAADVLFGRVNPSAKLPLTIYKQDYLTKVGPILDFSLTSGVGRTYRYLRGDKPLFYFGYGLSYTTYSYAYLNVIPLANRTAAMVQFKISNTGRQDGNEIYQVYVTVPARSDTVVPVRSLRAFDKVAIEAGHSTGIQLVLYPDSFLATLKNGSKTCTSGQYEVCVSGHQPGDALGEQASNTLCERIFM